MTQIFKERVSRISGRMMSLFLHDIFGGNDGESVRLGLPAGAIHLTDRKLIIGGTVCDLPMFRDAMKQAAISTGADVLVIHHGFYAGTLSYVWTARDD